MLKFLFKYISPLMKRGASALGSAALIFAAFCAGLGLRPASADLSRQFALLLQTMQLIRSQAMAPPDELALMRGATRGLLESLEDPYSSYLEPADFASLQSEKSGQVVGVGLELAYRDQQVQIMSVLDGTPAAAAGLRPGDRLLSVAGRDVGELAWAEILRLLQGAAGEPLSLSYQPAAGGAALTRTLIREVLDLQALSLRALPMSICQLRLRTFFNENLAEQVATALGAQAETCAGGVILDLRNNPGGLLTEAISVAGQLGVQGTVVQILGRDGTVVSEDTLSESVLPDTLPMVVLINGGTASAAEVLAAALQESGRAVLMGDKSFGKGLVQSLLPLSDGSGMTLTTHRYLTRRGRNLQQAGIEADQPFTDAEPEQQLLQAHAYLLGAAQ